MDQVPAVLDGLKDKDTREFAIMAWETAAEVNPENPAIVGTKKMVDKFKGKK